MASWLRRWWWAVLPILGAVVALGIDMVLSVQLASTAAPLMEQAAQITDPKERVTALKEVSQYQIDNQIKIWTGIVQAIGVVVLAVGGYFTWRNLRATQTKLDIDREGQITNRFTQAVAQLGAELKDGKPNLEVRLGGIYTLERIAHDSPRDHWTIMEVLTAYVRQNARWSPLPTTEETSTEAEPRTEWASPVGPRTDIQAILTVLGRRVVPEEWPEPAGLDLMDTDLRGANLPGAHLERAILPGAHLERAILSGAHLEGAILLEAHLEGAILLEAHLEGAVLAGAHLEEASLGGAHLERAYLRDAHLEGADLPEDLKDLSITSTEPAPTGESTQPTPETP